MSMKLPFTSDDSAQLDRLLAHYLQVHQDLHPIACPSWRAEGWQAGEQSAASRGRMDDRQSGMMNEAWGRRKS